MNTKADADRMTRMSTASLRSVRFSEAPLTFDKCLIIPILVYAYSLIISPMLMFVYPTKDITASHLENQVFWPLVTGIALGCLALRSARLTWPPHIIWLAAYLALAGASILWAFKPEFSFTRFNTQMMMLIAIIPPAMVAARTADMLPGVFCCFALGSMLNAVLILDSDLPL